MKPLGDAVSAVARALGIDEGEFARRKAFLELSEDDVALLKALHARLRKAERQFVDDFYAHLLTFEETRRFIPDDHALERLKLTQAAYFESLTAGEYGGDYIRDRLRVGLAHERIGLAPKWYIGAYSKYLCGLLPEVWRLHKRDPDRFIAAYRALLKIVLLDMGLAIDTYIHTDQQTILGLKAFAENIHESLPAGLLVVDADLRVLRANRSFREMFNHQRQSRLEGETLETVLPIPGLCEQARGVLASGVALHGVDAMLNGKHLLITLTGIRLAEEEEEERRLLMVVEDVSERERLREEVHAHERSFHDLIQGLDAIVWEAEVRGQDILFTFISDHAEVLLGYPVQRWLGHEFWPSCVHPDDRDAVFDFYNRVLERGKFSERFEIEYRAHKADGEVIWLHDVASLSLSAQNSERLRGITVDVTARKDMESRLARLTQMANHDPLTGLPNRNLLADRLAQMLVHATRHRRAAAVLFLDIDRFKTINDSLGHGTGDRLLKVVAERLRGCVREGDTVARLGGDEFVVILGDMARPQDATLVAQKIIESFVPPFRVEVQEAGGDAQEFFVTTSIGISLYPGDGEDVPVLLKNADIAMYRAKEHGGNSYQFFMPEMDARGSRRLSMESALHTALEQNQFVLHYQPQVDLSTRRVMGVEALLRWNRPGHGLVLPSEFISLLEETGLIVPVGDWVLREACAQAKAWRAAGLPAWRVAVNLSARQLRDERLVDRVAQALADTGMDPDGLEIEITESAVMQQIEASLGLLRRVRALGVRLSMDDFGTGYSSLSHLKLLPIDAVKIDHAFVRNVPNDEDDAAIFDTIVALARTLRLDVIAEGVETREQLAFLRAHGCGAAQGFLFSRPVPADELSAWLHEAPRLL